MPEPLSLEPIRSARPVIDQEHSMSRLAGHGLRLEGSAFSMPGQRARDASGPGMALCECGTYSPSIKNRSQRKKWHKDHKDDIRAGGSGAVWEETSHAGGES